MRLRIVLVLVLLIVGVGAVAITLFPPGGSSAADSRFITTAATRTDVVNQVVATGTVGPVATYSLAFGSSPSVDASSSSSSSNGSNGSNGSSTTTWKVLTVTAAPGQKVARGDVLATADPSDAQLAVTVAQANLAAAQAKLSSDKAGLTPNDKAAAKLSITQAQQSLGQAVTSRSQTASQNNLKLRQAEQAVTSAKNQLARDRRAKAPAAQINQDKAAVTSAQNNLASLRLQVSASNSQASNQVRSAQLQVQSAKYGYKSKTARATSATIASDEAAVATAQQSVATAQARLDGAKLVSPVDGTVLSVSISPGVEAPSGAAMTVQTAAMEVSAEVSESDLPSVQLGQEATVTLTATKKTATGKVTEINPSGSAGTSGGVVSYGIVVSLDQPPAGTASGMSTQISVTTASATNVVAVPAIALVQANGQYAVRVVDASGQAQLVPVTVGLVTTSYAEIKSGLEAGQAVVVGTSSSRQGTSTTTNGGFGGLGGGGFGGAGNFRGNDGGTRVVIPGGP